MLGALLACGGLGARAQPAGEEDEETLVARLSPNELSAYHELRILMNPHQMRQYLLLPGAVERSRWIERFWRQCDPTPATDENERRAEHEQRILLARRLFPSRKVPGWDVRGETLIRFGVPDSRAVAEENVTPSSYETREETWQYSTPPMVLQFQENIAGEYVYSIDRISWHHYGLYAVPAEPDYIADALLIEQTAHLLNPDEDYHPEDSPLRENELYRRIEERGAIHACDLDRMLPLFFDFTTFREGDGTTLTNVNFEVPVRDVAFAERDGERRAEIRLSVAIRDRDWRTVARADDCIEPAIAENATPQTLLPGQAAVSLPPGYYRVGIEARDPNAGSRAAFTTTLRVEPLDGSPAMSDILFASGITESEEGGRFRKGALRVVPHPLRAYRIPFPLSIYFEIYGLDTSPEGMAYYRVEYRIVPLDKRRVGPVLEELPATAISSSFETSGFGAVQPQRLSIATENLWEGRFRLAVTVTDRRTFRTATRAGNFSIVN